MSGLVVRRIKPVKALLSACISFLVITTGTCLAQTIEFLEATGISDEYNILQYSLLPDNLPLTENEESYVIQHRLFVKKLSGEWIGERDTLILEEELFVRNLIDVYKNLSESTELESVLDEVSYARTVDLYESNPNEMRIDKNKYVGWSDVRPFAVVRYGNMHLIVCDVVRKDLQDEYVTEIIRTVYHQGEYRLTEALDLVDAYDGIINSYLHPNMAEGKILAALRIHAGVVDN